ncbi:MAG TPA: aminomethyl-transferring glycine dehydrogenase subunit GcvPB [Candidatus Omnitrophica bacterium]|nr:MAG: glycine dehydrogenase (aminomethyl-transferring) [Omnitrophica WOR_2 bacterium GWA2_63_20]OGX16112.1 MAG: glycine dehydrogenase (aminomethyl-transferring) [Omnitrophica WOR_2 bacterium GWF2_63_9]OGX31928.1 MAG: glycine dehydrogenase (aminomethyl-transferring) [Omnitrophica WOR_2 bacterium RIFCSPHIGHO2_12_FULL_64_13]OGX34823.1 MAG: glycine dehydrogenase (aminomethyl-transferring) [Omnitrophica WOR_2 bacterium RIFCSPHIGHO2_02_FULL_63_39]OGX45896.1 MAG: glycine dehydrogenase (aminomethyl-t
MSELIFEKSVPGRRGYRLPAHDGPQRPLRDLLPAEHLRRQPPRLPEASELDVVRHYTRLSQRNFSVDTHFYPLGSCTMKYNPKLNDRIASWSRFADMHPLHPASCAQGLLRLLYELEQLLCEITGMHAFTLQPAAGAQGELTGLKMVRAYHRAKRQDRSTILIPDSAHGTNPASASLSGFQVMELKSNAHGLIDLAELRGRLSNDVAALMLTNPNTLGLFERDILAITALCHEHGALVYMDGANMNALLGLAKPGDMGVDLLQLNLHKTFSTPHGGGGPGAGPVGVSRSLEPFLPVPRVRKTGKRFVWDERGRRSIGRVHAFYGNVGVLVRAYIYIRTLGREGLERTGRAAILNANYLKARLADVFPVPFAGRCLHEFVVSLTPLKACGVTAWDVAKRLLDYGFYAPTVYFPLVVDEAFMIEPTETESRETLEAFANALRGIAQEARTNPELLRRAPHQLPVNRVDDVKAAREPNVRWTPSQVPVSNTSG